MANPDAYVKLAKAQNRLREAHEKLADPMKAGRLPQGSVVLPSRQEQEPVAEIPPSSRPAQGSVAFSAAGGDPRQELRQRGRARQEARRQRARRALGAAETEGPPVPDWKQAEEQRRFARDDAYRSMDPAVRAAIEGERRVGARVRRDPDVYRAEQEYLGTVTGETGRGKHRRPVTQEDPVTGEQVRVPGTIERQRDAMEQIHAVQQDMATQVVGEYATQLAKTEGQNAAMLETQNRRIEEEAAVMEGLRDQEAGIMRAVNDLEASAQVDPGRWWEDRTAGQKFGAVMGAIGLGLLGMNPMAAINEAIDRDIKAQQATFSNRADVVRGRLQEQGAKINLMSQLSQHAETQQELHAMVRVVRYEEAKLRMQRLAALGQVKIAPAQQQAVLAQLDQAIAQERLQLARFRAASTKTRVVSRRAIPRAVTREKIAAAREARGFAQQVQFEGVKAAMKGAKPPTAEEQRVAANLAEDTRFARAGKSQIDAMLAMAPSGEAPGRIGPFTIPDMTTPGKGAAVGGTYGGPLGALAGYIAAKPLGALLTSDEKKEWDRRKSNLLLQTQKWLTGANVAPEQMPHFDKILGELESATTAADEIKALENLRDVFDMDIQARERGNLESVRQQVSRNPSQPGIGPEWSSGGMPDSYQHLE